MPEPVQSDVICDSTSHVQLGTDIAISHSIVVVENHGALFIEEGADIQGYTIRVSGGTLKIGAHSLLYKADYYRPAIVVENGEVHIGHHNIFNASLYARFGGVCKIGQYTAIKQGTEIRCEESVTIGDFVMISYECLIFDTNTHQILPIEERRLRTICDFPGIGGETVRPITKPVVIGNDVWMGQRAAVLKGVQIGNGSIVGLGAVVVKEVPPNCLAAGNPARIIAR